MRCAVAKDLFQYNFQKQVAKSHGVVQASVAFLCIGAKALAPPLIAPHGKHNCTKLPETRSKQDN